MLFRSTIFDGGVWPPTFSREASFLKQLPTLNVPLVGATVESDENVEGLPGPVNEGRNDSRHDAFAPVLFAQPVAKLCGSSVDVAAELETCAMASAN